MNVRLHRSLNVDRLFNRILACEHDFNRSFLKCQKRSLPDLSDFLVARSALRLAYEQAFIEEGEFSARNGLHDACWRDCYEKVFGMLKRRPEGHDRRTHLGIIDEGTAFYSLLLLKADLPAALRYDFLVALGRLHLLRRTLAGRDSGAYRFFKEATLLDPFKGQAYSELGETCAAEGELVSALYWLLVALNTDDPPVNVKSRLYSIAKTLATSPSTETPFRLHRRLAPKTLTSPTEKIVISLVQLASHAVSNQLGGHSHQTHLDHLARSKLALPDDAKEIDWDVAKKALDILWMVLGSKALFTQQNRNVTVVQCCLLAKLFQVYEAFFPQTASFLIPFACNEAYYRFYSGANQEIARKIYPLSMERLGSFLKRRLMARVDAEISENGMDYGCFLDYLMLSSFRSYRNSNPGLPLSSAKLCLIECFVNRSRILVVDGLGNLRFGHETGKLLKVNRSMKLLTHRLLETQVRSLEASQAPALQVSNLPWTLLDFNCLVDEFVLFRKLVQGHRARFSITDILLSFMDAAKTASSARCPDSSRLIRDVIRFLYESVAAKDPSVCIEAEVNVSDVSLSREEFERIEAEAVSCGEPDRFGMSVRARIRFLCEQLKAMKVISSERRSNVQLVCRSMALYSSISTAFQGCTLASLANLLPEQ